MIHYVDRFRPQISRGNLDFDRIYYTQGEEIKGVNNAVKKIINNTYILTADGEGVRQWEAIFEIPTNKDLTLAERRMIMINRIKIRPPYTMQRLDEILKSIWGEGNYTLRYYPDEYRLDVDIEVIDPAIYLDFLKQIRNIVPANIYLAPSVEYTYIYLHRTYTYGDMEQFTYGDLSQYSTYGRL